MNHFDKQATEQPPLVIYHGGCADGQGAAAAFYARCPEAEFYAASYGKPVPDVRGRDVYLLDFSYPKAQIEAMCKVAVWVTIIDHHKSAMLDLLDFDAPNLMKHFDMGRSGAVMAWRYCWPERKIPKLLRHIEDRDLWNFEIENTREVSAWLYSLEFDIVDWASLLDDGNLSAKEPLILLQGAALLRQDQKRIGEITKRSRVLNIEGHRVPAVCCNHYFASDAGSVLAVNQPFAACYYDNADGRRVFSLRAAKGAIDVSLIAKSKGGGGHAQAAGFSVSLAEARDYERPQGLALRARFKQAWWAIRNNVFN